MTIDNFDCIVVGAGVVGSAMAHTLARDGRRVLLLERDLSEPDRIVGELLQPGGVRALERLGLADCIKGIDAIENRGYGVFYGDMEVNLPYPVDAETGKQAQGASFHHGRFIMKLREACRRQTNITFVEATVNSLLSDSNDVDRVVGVNATLKALDGATGDAQKQEFYAPLTIAVDGCFSKFRKEIQHQQVLVRSHFVGAILKDCPLPMPNHGHCLLTHPSPTLLYQIGTHDTRVLVDIPGKLPSASTGALQAYMLTHVMPQLPTVTQASFKEAVESQRLRVMPNSFLPAKLNERRGLIVMGDALNMRHPLTGGGMTVGLWDVVRLSALLHHDEGVESLGEWPLVESRLKTFHRQRKSHSVVINILAQALYELFAAGQDENMRILREACFEYFRLGGVCVEHPVGLLAGMIQTPFVLFAHFFAVAFYGIGRLLFTSPLAVFDAIMIDAETVARSEWGPLLRALNGLSFAFAVIFSLPINLLRSLAVLYTAMVVIFPLIWSELSA